MPFIRGMFPFSVFPWQKSPGVHWGALLHTGDGFVSMTIKYWQNISNCPCMIAPLLFIIYFILYSSEKTDMDKTRFYSIFLVTRVTSLVPVFGCLKRSNRDDIRDDMVLWKVPDVIGETAQNSSAVWKKDTGCRPFSLCSLMHLMQPHVLSQRLVLRKTHYMDT